MYVAGIQPLTAAGKTWLMAPRPAKLTSVDAGFSTPLGAFTAKLDRFNGTNDSSVGAGTSGFTYDFEAPVGTSGSLSIQEPGCEGTVVVRKMGGDGWQAGTFELSNGAAVVDDLSGGIWHALVTCS